ncbi:hypothetical protein [Desulfoscipio gibsoniae]|uniref:Ig-like domain-containing protein n=1 Tax=Desulfoscipio gibsoniae DSM 7213 TaxID=767817 RepID=R4KKJ3_9FIRM|nr:hypothetical protein [Desulfoscipio gibsoniae]AGL01025.1 hypothetical protein Desgi_1543 [Desulfoscipio gibsoniae DSM 7213]
MEMVLRRWITTLMLCALMVFGVTFSLAPPQAQADTVNDMGKQLEKVYDQLVLDPNGENDVISVEAKLANLSRDPNSGPWPDVFAILLTDQVITRLGGEVAAKDKIIDFVCDLADVQYSSKPGHLRKSMEEFKEQQASTITALFGNDVTIDYLYNYLLAAKGEVPNVISYDVAGLIALTSGDYGQIRTAMERWTRDALTKAASGQYSLFRDKLGDIGWSMDKLFDARDVLSAEVDPGYAGEIALMKAFVRSETHFLKDGKEWDKVINLKAGDTIPLKLSVLGFSQAGYVLHWTVDDADVATVDDSTKTLTGIAKGKTTLRAYISNPDTDWVYQGTVHVTGGGNSAH